MKNYRFEVALLIAIIVVTFIAFLGYSAFDLLFNGNKFTIITYPINIINCKGDECVNEGYTKYISKKYYSFYDDSFLGKYKLIYDEKLHEIDIYDKSKLLYSSKDNNNLYFSNKNIINSASYVKKKMSDEEIKQFDLSKSGDVFYAFKIEMDFDNDLIDETIYYLSGFNNIHYSLVAYKDAGSIQIIKEDKSTSQYSYHNYFVNSILDIHKDSLYEIIITSYGYDSMNYCTQIYRLNNFEFIPMNECEIVNY